MSQRLAELTTAIGREPDPAVRGRAAVHLLRDLASARHAVQAALDGAVRQLRRSGCSEPEIRRMLGLPGGTAEVTR